MRQPFLGKVFSLAELTNALSRGKIEPEKGSNLYYFVNMRQPFMGKVFSLVELLTVVGKKVSN